MADENKNQDPEEEKNKASSDDDFGLPDFEFDALEDDDDDEVSEPVSSSEEKPSAPEITESVVDIADTSEEEIPSLDADDLEDMDLEGIEDIDMSDLDDLGDLGDLDLEDLDLDDLDLDDLDKELANIDEVIAETAPEATPEAVSAERVEDIFDEPEKETNTGDSTEESIGEIEDDGLFYEDESFDEFDMDSSDGNLASTKDDSGLEMDLSDDLDSSMFDGDDEMPDVEFEDDSEAVPFAQRPMEGAQGLDEPLVADHDQFAETTDEDASTARSKFVRIVVLGIVLFVSVGFAFLYWKNGSQLFNTPGSEEIAKAETKKPEKKSPPVENEKDETTENQSKEERASDEAKKAETKSVENKPTETKTENKPAKQAPKETKKETKPKPKPKTVAQPTSSGGVTVLSAKTGRAYLIVASFADLASAQKHSNKLVSQGESPTIIPPFGGAANHRVAVASFDSFSVAAGKVDEYRQKLGSGVWVLRY